MISYPNAVQMLQVCMLIIQTLGHNNNRQQFEDRTANFYWRLEFQQRRARFMADFSGFEAQMENKAEVFDITKTVPMNITANHSIPTRLKVIFHAIKWS